MSGGGSAAVCFGLQPVGTISGKVFKDLNGNAILDPAETGIGGVIVRLRDGAGNLVSTATTVGDGTYVFAGVAAGSYAVEETDPAGFASTTPNEVAISLATEGAASANFGDQPAGTISGTVFNDTNGDGIQSPGEAGIGGATLRLFNSQHELAGQEATAGGGTYVFTGVEAGFYSVVESDPAGFVSTTSDVVAIMVTQDHAATANFGDQHTGTVSGRAFNDVDGDGSQDAGEAGIGGVTIRLEDSEGVQIGMKLTAGDGTYVFTAVLAESYTVEETDPEGFVSTSPNVVYVVVIPRGAATANFGDRSFSSIYLPVIMRALE